MASNEEILAGLAEIVNEETGLAPEAVELDKSFTEDLDIDSISMMTIVVNAEEKFGVRIPDEEVKNLKTVGDAVDFISSALAYAGPGRIGDENRVAGPMFAAGAGQPMHHQRLFLATDF
jgi:acyl carrier protein